MSSVSTALKVHYNQKLGGGGIRPFGGRRAMASGGIDAPVLNLDCVTLENNHSNAQTVVTKTSSSYLNYLP